MEFVDLEFNVTWTYQTNRMSSVVNCFEVLGQFWKITRVDTVTGLEFLAFRQMLSQVRMFHLFFIAMPTQAFVESRVAGD